jgi:multiple sugar transport system permease protein
MRGRVRGARGVVVTTEAPPRPSGPVASSRTPRQVPAWRRGLRPYVLSIPAVLIIVGILYPFVLGAYYAFLNYAAVVPRPSFVGLENFAEILSDPAFWASVRVTVLYAVAATVIETVLGIGIALLLNRSTLIGRIFERVLILPLMIAPVIAGVIWGLMFNPQFGVLNHVLGLGSTVRAPRSGRWSSSTSGSSRRSSRSSCWPGSGRCRRSRSRRRRWTGRAGSTCSED